MESADPFVHVLLFRCPGCSSPLSAVCVSALQNLEPADARRFEARCHCGWYGGFTGMTAVKHWVEPWEQTLRSDDFSVCDDEALG